HHRGRAPDPRPPGPVSDSEPPALRCGRVPQLGQLVLTGPPQPPDPNERPALKDTIRAMPGFVNRLIAKFDLPTGTTVQSGQKFRYVFHCHIAEHEDNEMMRPYDVVAP